MTEGKELAPTAKLDNYPALLSSDRTIAIIRENLGGEQLTPFNMDRISVPRGGGDTWSVPTLTGNQSMQVLTGIILRNQYYRARWTAAYGQGESGPPDCHSWEPGGVGIGDPGVQCDTCQYNQFSSHPDPNRRGKACAEKRYLFLLMPGRTLPVIVQAPSTSLMSIFTFSRRLAEEAGKKLSEVVVDLKLSVQKKGGYDTAVIVPTLGAVLSEEDCVKVTAMQKELEPLFASMTSYMAEVGEVFNES